MTPFEWPQAGAAGWFSALRNRMTAAALALLASRRAPLQLLFWSSLLLPPLLAAFLVWVNYERTLAAAHSRVALLDVDLRGEHVFEAAAELRARQVPIVFRTGFGDLESLDPRWRQAQVLRKPFTRAELAEALKAAIA